jgi:hypothetical protein
MVEITIFVEGGVVPNEKDSVLTVDNSQRFRESFRKLLSQLVNNQNFKIIIENRGGYPHTIKSFKNSLLKNENSFLLIDLDKPPTERVNQISYFKIENEQDKVFFMVQKMEAWILSQPEKIEECYKYLKRVKTEQPISEDNLLKDKHPENIYQPDSVLNIILQRYFEYEKQGKVKKKKYGKLKDAPDLIEKLEVEKLKSTFQDVERIYDVLFLKNP